jgi:hypothetical protein
MAFQLNFLNVIHPHTFPTVADELGLDEMQNVQPRREQAVLFDH